MTKTDELVQGIKNKGYKILKIEARTAQTDFCVNLEKGFHITYGRGGYILVRAREDGCFVFYPVKKTVDQVLDVLKTKFDEIKT